MCWTSITINKTQDEDKKKQNKKTHTICVGLHYAQTNTNNVDKTWAIVQTTVGKDKQNIVLCGNRNGHHKTKLST